MHLDRVRVEREQDQVQTRVGERDRRLGVGVDVEEDLLYEVGDREGRRWIRKQGRRFLRESEGEIEEGRTSAILSTRAAFLTIGSKLESSTSR